MLSRFGKWLGELCWGVVWGCYKGFIRGEWVFYLFAECCVRIEVGGGMSVGALWGLCAVFVVSVGCLWEICGVSGRTLWGLLCHCSLVCKWVGECLWGVWEDSGGTFGGRMEGGLCESVCGDSVIGLC